MGNRVDEILAKAAKAKKAIDDMAKAQVDEIQQVCRHEFVTERFVIGFGVEKCTKCNLTKKVPCQHEFVAEIPIISPTAVLYCTPVDGNGGLSPCIGLVCTKCHLTKKLPIPSYCPKCFDSGTKCLGRFSNDEKQTGKPNLTETDVSNLVSAATIRTAHWIDVYRCQKCHFRFAIADTTTYLK